MNKITKAHQERKAFVYVRQSTMGQVQHNLESQRLQYQLKERALQLGWSQVEIVDEDLGLSGSGSIHRAGFERLCHHVCLGEVGAIFCFEASRLARNGREWHTLLDMCGLVCSLIIDQEGIYDPRLFNDRLLLGMKGAFSEMELSLFRQRSQAALREKALRGELFTTVPIGYQRVGKEGMERNPDRRVAEAIALLFRRFRQLGSVRQTLLWFRQEQIDLPFSEYGLEGRRTVWRLPVYHTILKFLTNPIYAGAYAYGRTKTQVRLHEGRKQLAKGCRREMKDWEILIFDHHEGYISWEEYLSNQNIIAHNTNQKALMVRGAANRGGALLAGLLRCGHCGRKLHVAYSGQTRNVVRYYCRGALINDNTKGCLSFGGLRVDRALGNAVLEGMAPLGVEAAMQAATLQDQEQRERIHQKELCLQEARYQAARAARQYHSVDPENRLVASELEKRWNDALDQVHVLEDDLRSLTEQLGQNFSAGEKAKIAELGRNLPQLWHHPAADVRLKKRILRTVLVEVVVQVKSSSQTIELFLHWQGGDHTQIVIPKNRHGRHRHSTDQDTIEMIRALARSVPDKAIVAILNRMGSKTGRGNSWTEARLRSTRNEHHIAIYVGGERERRGEVTLQEAADLLQVSPNSVRRLIRMGIIDGKQFCPGTPWIIKKGEIEKSEIQHAALRIRERLPLNPSPEMGELLF